MRIGCLVFFGLVVAVSLLQALEALLRRGPAGWTLLVIVAALIVFLVREYGKQNAREREAITAVVRTHASALKTKRLQLVNHDAYGNPLLDGWMKEIEYFTSTVVRRRVSKADTIQVRSIIEQVLGPEDHSPQPASQTPLDFEKECAGTIRQCGWSARTTPGSGDQGIDVIAERNGVKAVFQCKLYSKPVGNAAVQEIAAGRQFERAKYAAVVSNQTYTPAAMRLAASNDVALLHPSELETFLAAC